MLTPIRRRRAADRVIVPPGEPPVATIPVLPLLLKALPKVMDCAPGRWRFR